MSNFDFLNTYWPDFAKIMEFAENYVYTDPASSKNKSGLFLELMVREILRVENIPEPEDKKENTHYNRIKLLKENGVLPYDANQWINQVSFKVYFSYCCLVYASLWRWFIQSQSVCRS